MTTELPVKLIRRLSRRLAAARAITSSPFTGTQQVQDWGGRWWEYEIEIATTQGAEARAMSAFLDSLAGGVGIFMLRDPSMHGQANMGTGAVNGAGQSGTSLVTDGWTGTALKTGDFFDIGSGSGIRLHRLTADVVIASGAATLQFVPPLRTVYADNATINTFQPRVMLRPSGVIPTEIGRVDKHAFTITAREAI